MQFTDGIFGTETVTFEMICCHNCGIPFMVTAQHRAKLLKNGESFYCPSGHAQHYIARPKECPSQLKKTQQRLDEAWQRNGEILKENWALKQELKENMKITCEHCGKRVLDINRHNKKYHS
jgi:DNA-directed RNA polymerase subunit RPC12/RpoP